MQKRSLFSAALLGCVVSIAGCGGGSSDTGSTSTDTDPLPSNQTTEANSRGNAQQNQNNEQNNQNNPPSTISNNNQTEQAATDASADLGALAILDGNTSGDPATDQAGQEFNAVTKILTADAGALAVTTTTEYCGPDPAVDTGNGSVTTENNDQDPPGRSTGDSVTVTFNQCVKGNAVNGRTIDGTRTYVLNTFEGEPYVTAPWAVDTTATSDITITTSRGSFAHKNTSNVIANSTDGIIITRKSTGDSAHTSTPTGGGTAENSARTFDISFTSDANAQTYTFEANTTIDNSTRKRTVVTDTPITGTTGGAPNAGVVTITNLDVATQVTSITKLTVQADGTVLVEVDDNGDGTVDSTTTQPWIDLIRLGLHFGGSSGGSGFANGNGHAGGGGNFSGGGGFSGGGNRGSFSGGGNRGNSSGNWGGNGNR